MNLRLALAPLALLAQLAAGGCKESDPPASIDAPTAIDADVTVDAPVDASPADANPACVAAATDYTPREQMSATDPYPTCVSDADPATYVVINPSVSTIARVAAFEQIATLLFTGAPGNQAFIDARVAYSHASARTRAVVTAAPSSTVSARSAARVGFSNWKPGPAAWRPVRSSRLGARNDRSTTAVSASAGRGAQVALTKPASVHHRRSTALVADATSPGADAVASPRRPPARAVTARQVAVALANPPPVAYREPVRYWPRLS